MKRILLFLLTNLAVILVISVIFSIFGIGNVLDEQGVDLDLQALLIYSAVIGFTGSFISLAMSKFMAKRSTGCQNIEDSTDPEAQWIVSRVRAHAEASGIGMPEVCVFPANEPNAFATGMRRDSARRESLTSTKAAKIRRSSARALHTAATRAQPLGGHASAAAAASSVGAP